MLSQNRPPTPAPPTYHAIRRPEQFGFKATYDRQKLNLLARICASFMHDVFFCSDTCSSPLPPQPLELSEQTNHRPTPSSPCTHRPYSQPLKDFIRSIFYRTHTTDLEIYSTLFLLARLKVTCPDALSPDVGDEKLFVAACLLAHKTLRDSDELYSNKYWAEVIQNAWTLQELNETERILCLLFNWDFGCCLEDLSWFRDRVDHWFTWTQKMAASASASWQHAITISTPPPRSPLELILNARHVFLSRHTFPSMPFEMSPVADYGTFVPSLNTHTTPYHPESMLNAADEQENVVHPQDATERSAWSSDSPAVRASPDY